MAFNLPTLAEVQAARAGKPILKGKTRLEETVAARPLTKIDQKAFTAAVWRRDGSHCRCCQRQVDRLVARLPGRGEVHHIHGRTGDLRFEVRAALLVCLSCHERLTGKVNAHRLTGIATKTFETTQGTFTDATYPIVFRETP